MIPFLLQIDPPLTLDDVIGWTYGRFVASVVEWLPLLLILLLFIRVCKTFWIKSGTGSGRF